MTSGVTVRFVHYGTGNDANDGLDRESPLKTLGAANTASNANDWIVLLDGHEETLTATVTVSMAGLVIVGAGELAGKPTTKIGMNAAGDIPAIILNVEGCQIRHVWFNSHSQASEGAMVYAAAADCSVSRCYFECGQHMDGGAVQNGGSADRFVLRDNEFVSTATSLAARPDSAVTIGASVTGYTIEGCVFDGGQYSFTSGAIVCSSGVIDLRGEQVSLLRGADAHLSDSTGYFMPTTTTGNSRVTWNYSELGS